MNRTGSKILHGLLLATSGLVGSTLIASTAAMAGGGPTGGKVAVGSATIVNASPTQTVINQSSKKALINWNSFSIPTGSSVKFNQPTGKSLAVNRVTGPNASTIDGQLLANGSVWLINANGVLFGKGSQVNVGSLLATTSDLSDDDFKKGNYSFKSATNPNAGVVNKGTITAGPGGSVVLSAPNVSNEGLIHADLGTVVLGGAKAFTVDMTGDNLLRYEITAPVDSAPRDANGNPASALVSNSGTIMAAGGHVMMTARAARNIENNVINNTGMVEATTVSSHNGEIDLDAGPDGTVNDSGTLNASGAAQGQIGGTVNVTGGTVNVADGANINVSGNAGGGTVQIGGGLHGGGTLAHAQRTVIGNAAINADATGRGNGGTVAVWSDGATSFAGAISAKGGAQGGNGGQVETSGHTLGVAPSAKVDTSAPLGLTGDWLLDPSDILISATANGSSCCSTTCITPSSIVSSLSATNVIEQATNTLTIDTGSSIVYNSAHSLTLQAGTDLTIGSTVSNAGTGSIEFDAGNSIFINAQVTALGSLYLHAGDASVSGAGAGIGAILDAGGFQLVADTIHLANDKGSSASQTIGTATAPVKISTSHLSIAAATDNIFILSPSQGFDIGDGSVGIAGNNITLTAAGNITQASAGEKPVTATGIVSVTTTGGAGNNIALTDAANSFGTAGVLLNTSGNASLYGTGDTVIGVHESPDDTPPNFVVGGNLTVVIVDGGLTLAGRIHANGSGITTLESDGDLDNDSNGDGTIIADNLTLISNCGTIGGGSSSFELGAPGTDTLNLHAVAADDININPGNLNIGNAQGGISAGGNVLISGGGPITQTAGANGAISAGSVDFRAIGDVTLTNPLNAVSGNVSFTTTGNVSFADSTSFTLNNLTGGADGNSTLPTGNVALTSNGSITVADNATVALSGDLMLLAMNDIDVQSSIENDGSGNITLVAGWDGGTTSPAALTGSGAYGVGNQGNVTVAGGNVFVGSASGAVLVEGFNVSVTADGGYAQIGYNGGGTGDITVNAQNDVMLFASDDDQCDGCSAQIGNGGYEIDGNTSGDINVNAGGYVSLNGGAVDTSYVQIGNGGYSFNGTIGGDVTVQAGGAVTLTGGEGSAQIGNGGVESNGTISGNITVIAGDDITLEAGDGGYGYAQIGNGGDSSTSTNSGDIVVNTTGAISLTGGSDYAQIGNGGYETTGGNGNITVIAGGDITLTGGEGGSQIGNGGQDANGGTGDIIVTSSGSILLDGGFDYAEIGNGGFSANDDATGNITVSAVGDLTLTGGEGGSQIGNSGASLSGNVSGDIAIKVNGATTIDSEGWIGNWAQNGNASGNVSIITGSGSIDGAFLGSDLQNGNVLLGWTGGDSEWDGGLDYTSANTLSILGTGNIDVKGDIANGGTGAINLVAGWDGQTTNLPSLTNTGVFGQNHGAVTIDGANGDVSVGSAGGTTTVLGYDVDLTGANGSAQIGYRGVSTGNIVVRAAHDVVLTAGAGNINCCGCVAGENDGFAQIGNGGAFVSGPDGGNITVSAANNVTLTGGPTTYSYASIGNGGDNGAHGANGNINVTAGGSVSLTGGVDYAQIGNGQRGSADSSGNITVTAAQNITLQGASNSSKGYAQIGNGGQNATGNISGNVQIGAGGALSLTAGNAGMYAQIGNGADKATTSGGSKTSGNISITAGSLSLTGSTSSAGTDSYAQIGNTAIFSSGVSGSGAAAGGINMNVTGATTFVTTAGQGHVWIGNLGLKGGSESGSVSILSGTFNSDNENNDDIQNFVVSDLVGGNLTIGVRSAGATLNIGDELDYSSANNLLLLTAGNLTISGGIQNAGSGNITLVTGWNPNVAPANVLTTAGSYGNGNTGFTLGGSGATDDSMVGSALGTTTVLTKNLNISAVHDTAGLGFEGVATGNIVVNALGNIAAVGQGPDTFAIIGNLGIGNQAVSGNITIADSGSFTLTNAILGDFDLGNATVGGNIRLTTSSLSASGASVLSGNTAAITLTGAGANVGSAANPLLTDVTAISVLTNNGSAYISAPQNGLSVGVGGTGINLGSGNLVLNAGGAVSQTAAIKAASLSVTAKNGAVTLANTANVYGAISLNVTGSFSASIVDTSDLTVGDVAVGGDLTLRTRGDLTFTKSVQLQNGSILAIAGWDGTATGATANGYGNNGGDIFIGGANAAGGVAIGSASGTTTLAAANVTLSATNGYAQIGYHGGGGGPINLLATGNVALNGGASTGYFAQIGDGGYKVSGSSSEAISVVAGGDIGLNAGAAQEAYAQIGNGGAESNSNSSGYSETGLVTVRGKTVTLAAGSGTGSYAQIGHGGYKSGQGLNGIATLGGNIAVNAVNAIRLIGGGVDGYAQIGQGGDFLNNGAANGSSGTISGDIAVAVAAPNTHTGNDPLTLTAGTGANSFAQIGNGGQGENIPAAGANVTFVVSGNVTVADLTLTGSNTGANGYAQVGNGDASKTGFGDVGGQVTLGQGTDVTYVPGKAPGSSAGLGNVTGFGTATGTLLANGIDAGTQGTVASINQNSTTPTNFNISMITVTPQITLLNLLDNGTKPQGPTPLDQLADNSNSEGETASDSVSQAVGESLGEGKAIYITSMTIIPGMLEQIVTLTRSNPNGIPPADEDYSSWGNEALWRW